MPKAIRKLPSAEYLRQCFEYNAATGELRWRHRPQEHFETVRSFKRWNTIHAGHTAGWQKPDGYLFVCLNGVDWHMARIIYKMHHEDDPGLVDHIDRDRKNNRIDNLRTVTYRQSNRNRLWKVSAAGFPGVWRDGRRFGARIWVNGRSIYLGCFATAEEAHAAYRAADNRRFGEFSPFKGI
jgi:hypothetical protein